MVEAFHIREEDAVRVQAAPLRETTTVHFEAVGLPHDDAALAADVLVLADLRGVDSHGVSNMLRIYLDGYASGVLNKHPRWKVVRESPATATVDSDRGLGVVIAPKAMEIAISKARQTGLGMVTITNGGHMGMAAYHAMLALPHDMIGLSMTAAPPSVVPTFGREPRLGTNPIAYAVPAGEEPAFIFDMATSVVPVNKVRNARRAGAPLPPGMIADMDGKPIMEECLVPDSYLMLPLGSVRDTGSHKGYGLAAVVEVLSGIIAGAGFAARNPRTDYRHMVAAYNIEAFSDVTEFKQTMDDFIRTLKATPPAEGHARVLVAGQPEWEAYVGRSVKGIPLHREVIDWFHTACAEHGVDCSF